MVENVISEQGLDLVDCKVSGKGTYSIIKFLVDKPGGVTLDECVCVSKNISEILDKHEDEIGVDFYRLEVSSPGESRLLTMINDFLRKIGEKVIVTYYEGNDIKEITGKIDKVDEKILVLFRDEEAVTVPFNKIIHGKLKFDF